MLVSTGLATARPGFGGVAVRGSDRLDFVLPASLNAALPLSSYQNAGYRLNLLNGQGEVEVALSPLGSRAPIALLATSPPGHQGVPLEVVRLARAVVAGAETQYEASSRLLGWMSHNIRYHLDRSEAQDALAVVERRTAYCSGLARLAVELHRAVGLESREVPGVVLEPSGALRFHRWLEVRLTDVGWVFSDPLASHHFVPANYLPLSSSVLSLDALSLDALSGDALSGEALSGEASTANALAVEDGLAAKRREEIQAFDLYRWAADGVQARRNGGEQRHGALTVLASNLPGEAILEGQGARRAVPLTAGKATFLGLELGEYRLRLSLADGRSAVSKVVFRERVHQWFELASVTQDSGAARFGRTR